jgi:hypothetical protein
LENAAIVLATTIVELGSTGAAEQLPYDGGGGGGLHPVERG